MKIGLVSPYVYPLPGGVTQHVRFLYENLRQRGHDVRILTASHGPQRASEGDIIRLGVGFSVPINASVGTLTFSPRYLTQIDDMLERDEADEREEVDDDVEPLESPNLTPRPTKCDPTQNKLD